MFLRVQKVKSGGKVYRYARLVRSVRRKSDGMPTQEVIANLGQLSDLEIANVRAMLKANREGKKVALRDVQRVLEPHVVRDSLAWLDVAVLWRLFRGWKLDALLDELMPSENAKIRPADVIASLVIQRLIAPGSKRKATQWFADTALPELLGVETTAFHNTRLHRVLERFAAVQTELEAGLVKRYLQRQEAFAALFIDTTDTWFFGQGPQLAEKGKTKEGMYRRKIGILLVCNEDGLPLSWEVLPGNQNDGVALSAAMGALAERSWSNQVPVVCDRAVGKPQYIKTFLQYGARFLVAMAVTEIERFTRNIPYECLEDLAVGAPDDKLEPFMKQAAREAEAAGFERVDDELYVLDLGVVTLDGPRDDEQSREAAVEVIQEQSEQPPAPSAAAEAIRLAWQLKRDRERGIASSYGKLADRYGISQTRAYMRVGLLRLPEDLLERVLSGEVRPSIKALERISQLDDELEQRAAFEEVTQRPVRSTRKRASRGTKAVQTPPCRVRAVAYFSPENFVAKRRRAEDQCREVQEYVARLNRQLTSSRTAPTPPTPERIYAKIDRKLRRFKFTDVFDFNLETQSGQVKQVTLQRDDEVWQKRRRYDGITLLVGHPELVQSGAELCQLYRDKTAIEHDFRIIKSCVELRPVFHRSDPKVQAHVSLCMLALLIERTLRQRLIDTPLDGHAPESILERLASCRLNRLQLDEGAEPLYTITSCKPDQKEILKHLDMLDLADDHEALVDITPR